MAYSINVLSDNSVSRDTNQRTPSYLEVKRSTTNLFENFLPKVEIQFSPVLQRIELLNLQELLQSVQRVLFDLKGDSHGEKALSLIDGITISTQSSSETMAKIENKKLVLNLNCLKAIPENVDQYLKAIIEKSL